MGYRSEVCLAIGKEIYAANSEIKKYLTDVDEIYETEESYIFRWDSVKWYPDYEDVIHIESFVLENCEDTGLIRIGEDPTDIEYLGSPHDFDLAVYQAIDLPIKQPVTKEDFFACNALKFIKDI